ncbi:GNAT family N-acetyltransferase [Cohnella sp.]|uniref:GNAT family N-acetyltransferase n=1 Tax=Cohnella sp. TaxID=1883426 RepID=UPI0035665F22
MQLHLRGATIDDLELLTDMNRQLIEDEGSSNPMNREQLKRRMRDWLTSDWKVDLLMSGDAIVGYALYQFRFNVYRPEVREAYIRQYFIGRAYRKTGYGLQGVELLKEQRLKDAETIEIDVLESNRIGKSFWLKAGFAPYVTNMRMSNRSGWKDGE